MTFIDFISENPGSTLIGFTLVVLLIRSICYRITRHLNIRAHGWPPPHLDADGDFKPEPEKEENP